MTNKEFKKKIAGAINPEWYKNVSVTFNFDYVNVKQEITGLTAIYEYVIQQFEGWNNVGVILPRDLENSKKYFGQIKTSLIQFIDRYYNESNNSLTSYWGSINGVFLHHNSFPLPYDIPETEFLIRVYKENPEYFQGAYIFLIGKNLNINNKDSFYGALLAYEFIQKDNSMIIERRNAEKNSISKIRNDFQKYLTESENIIVDHIKNVNDNMRNL